MITDDPGHLSTNPHADAATTASSGPREVALPPDLSTCHAMIQQLIEAQRHQSRLIDGLQEQIKQLMHRMYGRSSEKIDSNQLALFTDILKQLSPDEPIAPAAPAPQPASAPTSNSAAKGHGRRQLPADLPRVRNEIDLSEEEKPCPCCGKMRCRIGEEVSEKLDYVPAKIQVLQTVRFKYACNDCDEEGNGAQIAIPELPSSPIEKGLAAPGLLAYVIVSKYSDHLPLHRLEKILARHRIDISRSTMCDWAAGCALALGPLYELMKKTVLESKVIHTDDTPVNVLDKNRNNTRTGRFWVYLGDPLHPCTVFDYTPSRSRDGPVAFLGSWGKDKPVYLQADAFGGYDVIYKGGGNRGERSSGPSASQVSEVACWAHARRKFFEARDANVAVGTAALAHIKLLYDVEHQAVEQFAAQKDQPDARPLCAIRLELRQKLAVPRLGQFKAWLEAQQATRGGSVLPKSAMGQAIGYALNQWDALCVYTTDGDLSIDNNTAENALRRIAVGRNNWLFCGSDNGGKTAAVLFSFIATCERHGVNCFDYLRDVLERISDTPTSQLEHLLPNRWKAAQGW